METGTGKRRYRESVESMLTVCKYFVKRQADYFTDILLYIRLALLYY